MLISKFNRIIRNRIVWTFLGGIFALSLVAFIGPNTDGCLPSSQTGAIEGTLNGNPVTSRDFRLARAFELGMRDPSRLSEEAQARLRRRVWGRIAALHAAESMGITVSDEEMAALISSEPRFFDKQKGSFDKNLYARTIADQWQVDVETFEISLRQDLILRKLRQVMQSAVWSPESEVSTRLREVTDSLTVQGVVLSRSRLAPPPSVTQEDAKRLFDERPEVFRIADKRAVRYIKFPINDEGQPTPPADEIQAFYDASVAADKYTVQGTNGPTTIPLEQVRDAIATNLQHRAAIAAARSNALEFVLDLQPAGFSKVAKTFDAIAGERGLPVHTSRLFSATDPLPEFKAGKEFAKRAFLLDIENRDRDVSDAIVGEDSVFVLALHTNIESHLPDFKEVAEVAMRLARDRKQNEMFENKCVEVRKAIEESVSTGKSLEAAVAPFRLAITNFPVFSVYEEEPIFDNSDTIKKAVLSLPQGSVSDIVPVEDEAMLLFVKNRKPGSSVDVEMLRPQVTAQINGYRGNLVFGEWQEYLLKTGNLDDQVMKAQERATETPQ